VHTSYDAAGLRADWGGRSQRLLALSLGAALLLVLAFVAFWPPYFSRIESADTYAHVHAALGTAWLLLLIAQPLLVRARKIRTHRRLGRIGVGLGAAFVVSGVMLAHHRVVPLPDAQLEQMARYVYLPLCMAAIFAAAVALGVAWRNVAPLHGRFMACSTIALLDPIFARLGFIVFPDLPDAIPYQLPGFALAAVVLLLMTRGLPPRLRGRSAFAGFAIGAAVALMLFFATPYSSTWLAFVRWFRSLPITG
jgi:uncharacterized membrane protein